MYAGGYVAGEHALHYSAIGLEHGKYGAMVAGVKSWEWTKIAFSHLKSGASYAYHHGSIIGKDIMVGLGRYLIYFITNTRTATAEGAVKIWQGLRVAFKYSIQGASTIIEFTYNSIKWLIYTTYTTLFDVIVWSYYAFWDAKKIASEVSTLSLHQFKNFTSNSYVYLKDVSSQTYSGIINLSASISSNFKSFFEYSKISLINVKDCFVSFSLLTANYLYYFVSEFIVPFLLIICRALISCLVFFQEIFKKFFTDLIVYVSKFIYVTTNRIYSIFYFIVNFIYYFISIIIGSFKFLLVNVEIIVRSIFTVIIYLLQIIGNIYLQILQGYTNHKEKIFFGFMVLFVVYYSDLFTDDASSDNAEIRDIEPLVNKEVEALKSFVEGLNMYADEDGGMKAGNFEEAGNLKLTGMIMPSYDDAGSSDEDLFDDDDLDLDIDA